MEKLDYLKHIERESARFRGALADADPAAPVPGCPDWTAKDLLWHLTEVQSFWGSIVKHRTQEPVEGDAIEPDTDYQGLLDGFTTASSALQQALAGTPDDVPVWTWADDRTVGFIRRRQAHEVLIHRLDAEIISGAVTPLDPALADDGVDEILTVMYGGWPAWATFTPTGNIGRMVATDTGSSWDLRPGRFAGTSPNTGKIYDDPTVEIIRQPVRDSPSFTISGSAAQLDAWLWNRQVFDDPVVTGDPATAEEFLAIVAGGIQ